jgi:hypothetical protein
VDTIVQRDATPRLSEREKLFPPGFFGDTFFGRCQKGVSIL